MKKILFAFALFVLASCLPDLVHATTNAARVKNWTAEKLYAADLNTEFDNLVNYLNNNIAFVTNITASATQINQLNGNRFTQASTFTAAVTCSSSVTITTGTLSAGTTNVTPPADGVGILGLRGKSLQSVAADSLIAEASMTVAKFDTAGSGSNIVSKSMLVTNSVDSTKAGLLSGSNLATWLSGPHTFLGALSSAGAGATFTAGTITVTSSFTSTGAGVTSSLGTTTVSPRLIAGSTFPGMGYGSEFYRTGSGAYGGQLLVGDVTAQATGVGGGVIFAGKYTTAGDYAEFASARGYKSNATTADYKGGLKIAVNDGTTGLVDAVVVAYTKQVGIGGGSPGAQLDVNNGASYSRVNAGDAAWTSSSDRALKNDISPINPDSIDMLALFKDLEISTWCFKDDTTKTKHIGPMAQDFYRISKVLNMPSDSTAINWQTFNMAQALAIKQLGSQLIELRAWARSLQSTIDSLRAK